MLPPSLHELDRIRDACYSLVTLRSSASAVAAIVPVPGIDVGAEIAGVHKGRRGDPHMDLLRPGMIQILNIILELRSAYDGVVEKDGPFSADQGGIRDQLHLRHQVSQLLVKPQ